MEKTFSAPISAFFNSVRPDMAGSSTTFGPQELASLDNTRVLPSGRPADRFLQACIDYYNEWLDANATISPSVPRDRALLLIYAEAPSVRTGVTPDACPTRKRVFRKTLALGDGAAVCNENLHEMIHVVPQFGDADDAMSWICSHLTDDHAFAMLMLAQNRVLIHDPGLDLQTWVNAPRVVNVNRTDVTAITPQLIAEQLKVFHIESTQQPGGVAARLMWKIDETSVSFHSSPELRVQSSLLPFLRGAFRHAGAVVDEEIKLPGGRVDIRIIRYDVSKPPKSTSTMIELKVLNPDHSDDRNLQWAIKGVDQAVKYASYDTDKMFACIYDARRSKLDNMPSLIAHAQAKSVELLHHEMELPSPKPAKKSKASAARKSAARS